MDESKEEGCWGEMLRRMKRGRERERERERESEREGEGGGSDQELNSSPC